MPLEQINYEQQTTDQFKKVLKRKTF